jgi:hypothetical protein
VRSGGREAAVDDDDKEEHKGETCGRRVKCKLHTTAANDARASSSGFPGRKK